MAGLQAVSPSVPISVMQMTDQHRPHTRETEPNLERMDVEQAIHELLVQYAEDGVPEIVLLGVLREQARTIERTGYVSRRYESHDPSRLNQ